MLYPRSCRHAARPVWKRRTKALHLFYGVTESKNFVEELLMIGYIYAKAVLSLELCSVTLYKAGGRFLPFYHGTS